MDASSFSPRCGIRYEKSIYRSMMDFVHASPEQITEVAVPELLLFINSSGIHQVENMEEMKKRIPDEINNKLVFTEDQWQFLQDFAAYKAKETALFTSLGIEKSLF